MTAALQGSGDLDYGSSVLESASNQSMQAVNSPSADRDPKKELYSSSIISSM